VEARFAFTAQYWGHGAAVCRAVENSPGPVVEAQFGEFKTWTQANDFAAKLNEGLDLDPVEVRRIATSYRLRPSGSSQDSVPPQRRRNRKSCGSVAVCFGGDLSCAQLLPFRFLVVQSCCQPRSLERAKSSGSCRSDGAAATYCSAIVSASHARVKRMASNRAIR